MVLPTIAPISPNRDQLKLGPLNGATEQRIAEANSEALLRWAARVLTAEKLSDVFQEG